MSKEKTNLNHKIMKIKRMGTWMWAFFAIIAVAQAQPGGPGGPRGPQGGSPGMRGQAFRQLQGIEEADKGAWVEQRTARLIKKLKLNEDQASQVQALYGQNFDELKALQETHGPTMEAMRNEMLDARDKNEGDWESMRASMMEIREKYAAELGGVQESLKNMRESNTAEMELILTEEQFTTFEKMQAQQREYPNRRRPNRNGKNRKNSSSQR